MNARLQSFCNLLFLRKALRLFAAVCRRVIGADFSLQSQQMPHSLLVTSQMAEVWLNTPHRSITANDLFSNGYTAGDWVIGKKANFWGIEIDGLALVRRRLGKDHLTAQLRRRLGNGNKKQVFSCHSARLALTLQRLLHINMRLWRNW